MATTRKITLKKSVSWRGIARKAGHKDRTKTFTLKSQAYAWAIEQEALMEMIDNGDPDFAKSLPLEDCLIKEIETKVTLKEWKPSTQDRGISLKGHLTRLFGPNTPLSAINPPLVDRYQIKRLKEGASNSSIRQELSLLSTMFDRARRTWGVNIANPVKDIKKIAPGPASERILSEEEARIIYEEAINSRNPKFAAYILLLMHTGMRSGEASSLQQNSVYFEKKSIKITKTKTGKTRTVPLSDPVCHALKQIKINDNGYFFMKPNHLRAKNTILKPGAIWDSCWKNLRARVKKKYPQIAYFKAHDLRHTAASHLLMAGTDIRIVADILGHTNLATTMRYTHLLDSHKQETIAKISHLGMPQD